MQKRLKGPADSGVASIVAVQVEGFEGECGVVTHRESEREQFVFVSAYEIQLR